MVTHDKRLTIKFYNYRGSVRYYDLNECVNDANNDIVQRFAAGRDNNRMGTNPYIWSSGSVTLQLNPREDLTWSMWSLVPVTIQKFMAENELRGTNFTLLWRGIGTVGTGQLVTVGEATNSSTTTTASTALERAHPDPCDVYYPDGQTIEYYGYRGFIDIAAVAEIAVIASRDIARQVEDGRAYDLMSNYSYSYTVDNTNLYLIPGEKLTWTMWGGSPVRIRDFVYNNDFKGMQFIVMWKDSGVVGKGQLLSTRTGVQPIHGSEVS